MEYDALVNVDLDRTGILRWRFLAIVGVLVLALVIGTLGSAWSSAGHSSTPSTWRS